MQTLSYCAHEVYKHDRDLFLRSIFVPTADRETLLAIYALVVELEKIRGHISEEMIGHIRYAWWQETLESLYAGNITQGHPVLETLVPLVAAGRLPQAVLIPVVEQYRNTYPDAPADREGIIRNISLFLNPAAEKSWLKADGIIITHRRRYGRRLHAWLMVKLLIVGMA